MCLDQTFTPAYRTGNECNVPQKRSSCSIVGEDSKGAEKQVQRLPKSRDSVLLYLPS